MNDFLLSILLGIVEGLTEFLPVSSTGHLRIVEALFHLNLGDSFWKMYTIVIQLGAILALPVYFWKRILGFLSTFPKGERGDRNFLTHPLSLTLIAFVVTALPSWALTKVIGKNLESLWLISIALLVGGIVMWIVDATSTRVRVTPFGSVRVRFFRQFFPERHVRCPPSRPDRLLECRARRHWNSHFFFRCRRWSSRPATTYSKRSARAETR